MSNDIWKIFRPLVEKNSGTGKESLSYSLTIISDGFHRAAQQSFFTRCPLFFRKRLFVNKRITVRVGTYEVFRCCIAADVAVYARGVDIVSARDVFFYGVVTVGQTCYLMSTSLSADYADSTDSRDRNTQQNSAIVLLNLRNLRINRQLGVRHLFRLYIIIKLFTA